MLEPDELGRHKDDLAAILREQRKRAKLTGERLAARINMSQSKISKIETGKIIPSVIDVERILRALDAAPEVVAEITTLARLANTEFQDVRSLLRKGLEKKQHELAGLEATTTEFRFFLPAMITALISTPEYIRASLAHVQGDSSKAVAKKIERQAVLYDESKLFHFVLTEPAVRWMLCPPSLMAMQLDRLVSVTYLPNVRLGIIPLAESPARGPLNIFTIYDDRLVTAETFTGAIVMRDPRDVVFYRQLFGLFEASALFGDSARERLAEWAAIHRS
jgi:transcriptional regulator with XRE-family HTH domain